MSPRQTRSPSSTLDRGRGQADAATESEGEHSQVPRSNSGQAAHAARVRAARASGLTAVVRQTVERTGAEQDGVKKPEGDHSIDPGLLVAGQQLLELVGAGGESATSTPSKGDAAAPKAKKRSSSLVRYFVPVDDTLLQSENIVYELTLRMIEVGLRKRGLDLPRFDVQMLYYQVAVTGGNG